MPRLASIVARVRPGLALIVLGSTLSCGGDGSGGTGPNLPGLVLPLAIGDTATRSFSGAADSISYRIKASAPVTLVIYFQTTTGVLNLLITDSASGNQLGSATALPSPNNNLFAYRTGDLHLAAGQVILARARPGNSSGTIRIFPTAVNLAPETGSSLVAAGDTVRGRLEHPADIDRFFIHAANQLEFAAFIHSLKDMVVVAVGDSSDPFSQQYGYADAHATTDSILLHRTPTITIPAGHTAEIRIQRTGGVEAGDYEIWVYQVNRAPEHISPVIAVEDTVNGEFLENSADIDEFTLALAGPDELIAYLGASPELFPGSAWLTVMGAVLPSTPNIQHQPDAIDLEGSATSRFNAAAGQLTVEVKGVSTDVATGISAPSGYSLMLRHINRAPEHLPAILAPKDSTPGEQIDYVGDIDEFSVATVAGQTWNGFIHTTATMPVWLSVSQGASQLGQATSILGDTALADHFTANFVAPATGTLTFNVQHHPAYIGPRRGHYRVFAYPVNRAPETAPSLLLAGDSVLTETIELPGDVDSFAIDPGAAQAMNLVVGRPTSLPHTLAVTYPGAGGNVFLSCAGFQAASQSLCMSGILLPPPTNLYALVGNPPGSPFRGSFAINAYAIDIAPESLSAVLVLGDTAHEAIDPLGDRDEFTFNYQRGQLLDLWGDGGACSSSNSIMVRVLDLQGIASFIANCGRSGRFDLPQSGTYHLVASGYSGSIIEKGPYRFVLYQYPTTPEHVSPAIQPGDSIHGESMDEQGDVDDFLLSAPAGTEVQVRARFGYLAAFLPGDSLSFLQGRNSMTGRFLIPAGGQVTIRAAAPRGSFPTIETAFNHGIGPYDLVVNQINRAPEHASAVLTLGTQVTSEDLPYEGEVDEFTFQGTAGQVVTGLLTCNQGFDLGLAVLEILDPTGNTVLGSASTHDGTVGTTGSIILPANGTYIVRIQAQDDTQGRGGYQLTIQ